MADRLLCFKEKDYDLLQTEHPSPGKSILNNSTHDISDDLLDPQKVGLLL